MKTLIATLILLGSTVTTCFATSTYDLFAAIKAGNVDAAKAAIAAKADVDATDANGNTVLLTAVWYPAIVSELIAAKANVNKFANNKIMNPLMSAATWGEVETINALIAAGADVNARDLNGNTPLFYAAFMGASAPAMKVLIDKGADAKAVNNFNQNALIMLAMQGRSAEKRVEQLDSMIPYLEKAGVNVPDKYKNATAANFSSLEDRIDVLLKAGVGINDEAPLKVPATVPNFDKINSKAERLGLKQWPLYAALDNLWDRGAMVKALLAKGANAKKQFGASRLDWNLLHAMCIKNELTPAMATMNEEAADALIKAGADMNQRDLQGYTPLIKAAKEGKKGVAAALVKDGADLNVTEKEVTSETDFDWYNGNTITFTKTWRTARDWAAETKHTEIYDMIKAAGGKGAKEVK